MRFGIVPAIALLATLPVLPACSGSPASGSPATVEAGAPISFQNDVLPKLEHGCGLSSSCHQDPVVDPTMQRVFLGCDMALNSNCSVASPGPTVYRGLMGNSQEDPTMPFVTPGNPSESFLQYKLDGNLSALHCAPVSSDPILQNAPSEPQPPAPCGVVMPLGGGVSTELSGTIREWIMAGAPNN